MSNTPPPFVSMVAPRKWVPSSAKELIGGLSSIPAAVSAHGETVTLQASGDDEETAARIAESVRDLGVAFSAGKDWSPAAYIGFLKGKGAVAGQFTEIFWTEPGRWGFRTIE